MKFTQDGGHINMTARLAQGQLQVMVEDNGIGIDPDAIARIFSMFEQGRTVAGQIKSGLGIGLSLARQFAEMHGGSIEAYSDGAGRGSRFIVTLPASAGLAPVPTPAAGSDMPARAGQPVQVLVVDDNRDAADSLQTLFQLEGYAAQVAYGGAQALAAVEMVWPQLVVMDLGMPDMDGYEAARQIRQRAQGRDVLMIALTGWGQGEARARTEQAASTTPDETGGFRRHRRPAGTAPGAAGGRYADTVALTSTCRAILHLLLQQLRRGGLGRHGHAHGQRQTRAQARLEGALEQMAIAVAQQMPPQAAQRQRNHGHLAALDDFGDAALEFADLARTRQLAFGEDAYEFALMQRLRDIDERLFHQERIFLGGRDGDRLGRAENPPSAAS